MDMLKMAKDKEKNKFIIRFQDEEQRASIKARAALNRRTMNAEVLFLIEKGLASEVPPSHVAQ